MDTQVLTDYALARLRAGTPKAELREELLTIGWTEDEAEAAYRGAVVALGAPVPTEENRPTLAKKAGTVDVTINFFSFILLGTVATALGTLYFQIINHFFPDALDSMNWYSATSRADSIHYATAALIIAFPLYFLSLRLWFRKFREDGAIVESKLSKWLTYLVLLVTAVTMVGDAIALVYTLLQGEITARFFLKALIILAIAGGIFGFYFLERKKIQYRVDIPRLVFQRFGRGVALMVLLGIILGFVASGSPMTERSHRFDATRAEHLSSLSSCIEQYSLNFGKLPQSLEDFRTTSEYNYCLSYMHDPETAAPYEYQVVTPVRQTGATTVGEYELCATFTLASESSDKTTGPSLLQGVWSLHEAGRSCDTVQARLTQPPVQPYAPMTTSPALP